MRWCALEDLAVVVYVVNVVLDTSDANHGEAAALDVVHCVFCYLSY